MDYSNPVDMTVINIRNLTMSIENELTNNARHVVPLLRKAVLTQEDYNRFITTFRKCVENRAFDRSDAIISTVIQLVIDYAIVNDFDVYGPETYKKYYSKIVEDLVRIKEQYAFAKQKATESKERLKTKDSLLLGKSEARIKHEKAMTILRLSSFDSTYMSKVSTL